MWTETKGKGELQLWGGLECTVNRLGDRYLDQFEKSGHLDRPGDLERVAELGIRTLRYPVLWERTAPTRPDARDWRHSDGRLWRIRGLGMSPIVGLVHHGSGPRYTSLVDEGFAAGLADHARAVAERYPWVDAYTPVNEPLTTARFSGMYGHWYPHGADGPTYARALVNQVRATVLSMRAIRKVNPTARLVQTDDLGKSHATTPLRYQAEFENERRWITWDLLCGRVDRNHPMWGALTYDGISEAELGWFLENPCPPDVIGINHYLTSERFLDHRLERYPERTHGGNATERYADVEAIRVLAGGVDGAAGLLRDAWARYGLPLAITECHLGCTREEQVRWLAGVWRQAGEARAEGVDVRAVTVWSLFGAYDWCSLLTRDEGRYEPGVFDLRAPEPRPTLLAQAVRSLAAGSVLDDLGDGWWERPMRLLYPPVVSHDPIPVESRPPEKQQLRPRPPLLLIGAQEALGRAFAIHCERRGLGVVLLPSEAIDGGSSASARELLRACQPWGVVDARQTPNGPSGGRLAAACAKEGVRLVAFSGETVFAGYKDSPYVESDPVEPANAVGRAHVRLEREILEVHPDAMVVRAGALFGPWNAGGLVGEAARSLVRGAPFEAAEEIVLSPTFVPDLVDATLDLLLDGMAGTMHLANLGETTPTALARDVARGLRLSEEGVVAAPVPATTLRRSLASERAWVMPPLEDALARYLDGLRHDLGEILTPGYIA